MPTILAIDQSTSATKAVLFDAGGNALDRASREHRQIYPQPGWVEHDADEIWRNTLGAIADLAGRQRGKLADLACLSIANQRETFVIFDRSSGRTLANAIVWQCRRGDPGCESLRAAGREKMVRAKTGLRIDSYFSGSKLKWLMAEKPDLAAKLKSGEAVIGTIDAYLIHRLTNGAVFATDHTNASRTLLFDINRLQWDEELCDLFDVPLRALPEIREGAAAFGETTAGGVLPRAVPIRGVMGDSQAALFAQRCFRPGVAKASFGTGSSILLNIGDKPRDPGPGAVCALAWVREKKPVYAFEGLINFAAATLAWMQNQLGLIRDPQEAEALAAGVEDNGGVYLVPAFAGLSAPHWSPTARAAILGMSGHTCRAHVARAAEESIAYQIHDALEMMRAAAGAPLAAVCADGGPTRDRFLMQFTADITRADLIVADTGDAAAWGAAAQGLLGLGLLASLEELEALPRATTVYRPIMDAARARQWHKGWLAAVQRVL